MSERIAAILGFAALIALAVLSGIFPAVNIVMTILVISVFVIGGILAIRFLITMNARPRPRKTAHVPPEQARAVTRS